VGFGGVCKARQGHLLALIQRVEESFELGLVGMIGDVSGIEHLHSEVAPGVFVRGELHRVELVIQQAAFAAHEVSVEIVGLKAIDDGGAFADAAILEFHYRDAGGRVFVRREDFALGFRVVAGDFGDITPHTK